jgi:hypothetical protein
VPNGFHQEQKFSSLKQESVAVCRQRQILSTTIQTARPVGAEWLASGAEITQQGQMHHSGVERSDKFCPPHPSREADLRAKLLAAGAEILLAQAKIHSGVERSDKFCPPHPSREARARRAARIRSRNSLGSSKNP